MRLDIDTYREILDTLTRNKSRSFLTGFGVFWGVFMLVALIGGGQGMKELLNQNFEGFATNSAMIWAQPTTKAYKGFRKGRRWDMEYKDVQRLKSRIPELEVVSPVLFSNGGTAYFGDRKTTVSINGVQEDYQRVSEPKMRYGRYLNDMDVAQRRKVCVIQKKTYKDLFPGGGDPCGSFIRVDSVYYQIVGVDYSSAEGINFGGESGTTMLLPITLMQQTYNMGQNVHMIAVTGKKGVVMSTVTDRIRETIARAHTIDPEDEQGVMVFNTEVLFQMLDSLFKGVNFLIWLVGLGTLLAGAIGVSNIMMVTVRERTTDYLREYCTDDGGRHEWYPLCRDDSADAGTGQYRGWYPGCPLPGRLLDGYLCCARYCGDGCAGRIGACCTRYEHQTGRCYER